MKKIASVAALTAAVVGMASADISFGSWGRGLWITAANQYDAANDKTNIVQDLHQSWGNESGADWTKGPRTALAVSGDSDNVGFKLDIHGNGDGLGMGDNAYIWAKPIDQVKLYMGKLDVNALRGDACFGLWNWDRIGAVKGGSGVESEGWTFPGFVNQKGGVGLVITPVEGLTLIADIPLAYTSPNLSDSDASKQLAKKFSEIYGHAAKYGLAYEIPDVGTLKLAVETKDRLTKKGDTDSQNNVQIDAAFDLTSVENAFFSIGARIPTLMGAYGTADSTTGAYSSNNVVITGYGRYGVDALTAHFQFGVNIGADNKKDGTDITKDSGAVGFSLGAGLDYSLAEVAEGVGVFADVRYASGIWRSNNSSDNTDTLTFGLGAEKGWSNGKIGIAFEGTTNAAGRYKAEKADSFQFEVPVKVEYWF